MSDLIITNIERMSIMLNKLDQNLPNELKVQPHFLLADNVTKQPLTLQGYTATKWNQPHTQHTLSEAMDAAWHHVNNSNRFFAIGFVTQKMQPQLCVDFDIIHAGKIHKRLKRPYGRDEWTTQAQLDSYASTIAKLDTYTELSHSMVGVHSWIFGDTNKIHSKNGVEIFPFNKFVICTGSSAENISFKINSSGQLNVYADQTKPPKPIAERQAELDELMSYMYGGNQLSTREIKSNHLSTNSNSNNSDLELSEFYGLPKETDEIIWERARNAENGNKFIDLCNGDWKKYDCYPLKHSQSEPDFALLSFLFAYSKNFDQVMRMFRETELGKRDKATDDNRYLMVSLKKLAAKHIASIAFGKQLTKALATQQGPTHNA